MGQVTPHNTNDLIHSVLVNEQGNLGSEVEIDLQRHLPKLVVNDVH